LWRALDPYSAQVELAANTPPHCVLLLDEIDKADSDLPNSLLEVLGNRSFKTPWCTVPADPQADKLSLLIVITSNDERELPLAFLRRCVVLDLKVPEGETAFVAWLLERGLAQFAAMDESIRTDAAHMVWRDRQLSPLGQGARPGLAEYLDLLRALQEIVASRTDPKAVAEQDHWLRELSPYVLRKQGQDQTPTAGQQDSAPD
jgi:MoxR-like ATPase